jgi:hypothetical protein
MNNIDNNYKPLNLNGHNLDELISSQKINPDDLNNIGIVGQGHGGIVYKLVPIAIVFSLKNNYEINLLKIN